MYKLIVLAGACALVVVLALVPTSLAGQTVAQTLNPPPPPEYTCTPTGNGTICQAHDVFIDELQDIGIACGSGANTFDILGQGAGKEVKRRFYDANGNFTERISIRQYSFGQFRNPLTGAIVPFTQTASETDVLLVPGDPSAGETMSVRGENMYRDPVTHKTVLFNAGLVVTAPDGSVEFSAGPQSFLAYFGGDASIVDQLCAALAG
jgi:hypothetical protein